ncbi:MAG: aldo/keto reductase [Alphaproteobacteria bacterium]|nr:MAG: aldo/keto reductase [Alphaproteobacteria bacterium]
MAPLLPHPSRAAVAAPLRMIPSSGELLPPVGLGSWITFNVGNDPVGLAQSVAVMRAFFAGGGRLIDCSPMYGSSQATIGHGLRELGQPDGLFAADKIWTSGRARAAAQLAETRARWGVERFSLLQVHNLEDWQSHLPVLFEMKARGELRYVGVTTSHGRRHAELERIMTSEPLDFVQLTYNLADREAEARLLPLAQERGIAVIANRPYDGGRLIRRLKRDRLPAWAREAGMATWADFALGYLLAHPGLTTVIPATTRVGHVSENVAAGQGGLPDDATRQRMRAYMDAL